MRYADAYGANIEPGFGEFMVWGGREGALAVLGYVRGGAEPLFLERYLDRPIEQVVEAAYDCRVARSQIVEIGNLASCNGWALINLWGKAANDLGREREYAVATLTAPLRGMFRRIGLPIKVLAPAIETQAGGAHWGSYYQSDPQVCVGRIAEGQRAIARFLARHRKGKAA